MKNLTSIITRYPELEQRELSVIKWFRWAGYDSPVQDCPMAHDHGIDFVYKTLAKLKKLGVE